MQSWRNVAIVTLLLPQCAACAVANEDPLPAVRERSLLREPSLCMPWPPPPIQPPAEAPSDPRACLPDSWSSAGLPVDVRIINGRVTSFEFYNQCSGDSFEVAPSIRDCIRRSLSTWRYATWPACPGEDSHAVDVLHLVPFRKGQRTASTIVHGCSG
jgi:hypothetical protein